MKSCKVVLGIVFRYTQFSFMARFIGGKYMSLAIVGMMLHKVNLQPKKLASWLILFFALAYCFTYGITNGIIDIIACFIVFVVSMERVPPLNNRIYVFFGTISYSLYLIHQNVAMGIEYYMSEIFGGYQWFFPFIAFFVVILLAIIIHYWFEIPLQKKINSLVSRSCQCQVELNS